MGSKPSQRQKFLFQKRPVKLRALPCKTEGLEKVRKSKLNEAAALKRLIQGLWCEPVYNIQVKSNFDKYNILVNNAKDAHTTQVVQHTVVCMKYGPEQNS